MDTTPANPSPPAPHRHEVLDPEPRLGRGWHCPVDLTVAAIGGRWKGPILWYLLEAPGPIRFAELQRRLGEVTHRVLTRQLRDLENDGLIYRDVYPVVPPRVEYGLTPRGRSLQPVLTAMCQWGVAHGWTGGRPGKTRSAILPPQG